MLRSKEVSSSIDVTYTHPVIGEVVGWFRDEGEFGCYETLPKYVRETFYADYYRAASENPNNKIHPASVTMEAAREIIKEVSRRAENETVDKEAGRAVFQGNGFASQRLGTEFSTVAGLVRAVNNLAGVRGGRGPEIEDIPDSAINPKYIPVVAKQSIMFALNNLSVLVVNRLSSTSQQKTN